MTLAPEAPAVQPLLEIENVVAGYGRSMVLRNLSLSVDRGKITALVGANGAGKTTTLRVVAGLLKPKEGRVLLDGLDITAEAPHSRVRSGLCLIPEGRGIFRSLTVNENLLMARPPWKRGKPDMSSVFDTFPALSKRLSSLAGQLSGGQQQMLALARAFLAEPIIVLLDEVSMGLSPVMVDEMFAALAVLAANDTAVLLVEQYVGKALALADTVTVLEKGTASMTAAPSELDEERLLARYLGAAT